MVFIILFIISIIIIIITITIIIIIIVIVSSTIMIVIIIIIIISLVFHLHRNWGPREALVYLQITAFSVLALLLFDLVSYYFGIHQGYLIRSDTVMQFS